jgi:Heparan-alpha-glucosaminide N-acetyltransferase, catalytic
VWFRSPVAVILAYYGLLFVVAAPLLRLRAGPLAALAAACCVLAPLCSQALRIGLPAGPGDQPGLAALGDPGQLLLTLALTGYYPVLPWTTYVLAGMAVGRLDLGRLRAALGLLLGGAVLAAAAAVGSWLLLGPGGGAAVLGADALAQRRYGTTPTDSWWWLAVAAPHSGTPFDLAHTTGTALAVLGGMLLLARGSRGLVWVPAAVGAVPLTLYTTHVIALSLHEPGEDAADPARLQLWLVHVLAAVVIGVLLRLLGRSGPLEAVVSAAGRAVRRSVSRRPGPGTGADPPTTPLPTVTRPGDPGPGGPGPGTTRLPAIPQQAAAPGRVGPVGQLPPRAS